MVPFLSEEMGGILWWLIGFFIGKEVLKVADTSYQLSKLQVSDQNNWKMKSDLFFFNRDSLHARLNSH